MSRTKRKSLRAGRPVKRRQTKKAVRIAMTHLGYGVFARRGFDPEEIVGEVTGALVCDPDYESNYCMDLSETVALEPGPPFRYLNHSCQPNCTLMSDEDDDAGDGYGPRMLVEAIHRIELGDELTIDYAWPADEAMRCACRSDACRGWIVDVDELPELARLHAAADPGAAESGDAMAETQPPVSAAC